LPYRAPCAPTEGPSLGMPPALPAHTSAPQSRMFYVYILASIQRTLYIGVTNDLRRRVYEHKVGAIPGFTKQYRVNRLVYFEVADDAEGAIRREKQLKGWVRRRKMELIEEGNPEWEDLSDRIGLAEMVTRAV
jgi:putative endonuclease